MTSTHENTFFFGDAARKGDSDVCQVLLILNSDAVNEALVRLLWDRVDIRVCADGGANRLFDLSTEAERAVHLLLPDFIKGDLDSIRRTDVVPHYAGAGVPVLEDSNQDDTDLEKCLREVQRLSEAGCSPSLGIDPARLRSLQRPLSTVTVLVVGGFDGALHHDLGNIHALHRHGHLFGRILLLGRSCVAQLLPGPELQLAQRQHRDVRRQRLLQLVGSTGVDAEPDAVTVSGDSDCCRSEVDAGTRTGTGTGPLGMARHELRLCRGVEGPTCGLYPLQGRCERAYSAGLRWNLDGAALEFGDFVSTSNHVVSYGDSGGVAGSRGVLVEVSHTVLWTHEYRLNLPAATATATPIT